jgi:hypothetical protein
VVYALLRKHAKPQVRFKSCRSDHYFQGVEVALKSGEVETIKVHDFVPSRYEVVQELLL